MVFKKIKNAFGRGSEDEFEEEYMELDLIASAPKEKKILVKLFVMKKYEDLSKILDSIREGYTIAIVDFKILKQKDPIELKRAVAKLKKTVEAIGGSIAGHDNFLVVTPSFAKIHREIEDFQETTTKEEKIFE